MTTTDKATTNYHDYLIALVLALVAMVFCILSFALYQSRERALLQARQQAASMASIMEERVRTAMQSGDFLLDDIALHVDPAKRLPDPASEEGLALRRLLFEKWNRSTALANIGYLDAQGRTAYTMLGDSQANLHASVFFHDLVASKDGQLVISEPLTLPQLNEPGLLLARAVRDAEGAPIAFAVGWVRARYFLSLFTPLDLGPNGVIVLLDDQHHLLAHYPQDAKFPVGSPYSLPEADLNSGTSNGVVNMTLDGVPRIVAVRRLADYHSYLVVGIAEEDALVDWHMQCTRLVMVGVILGLFSLALVVMLRIAGRQAGRLANSESLLRQSEAHLRQLMELAPAAMAEVSGTPPTITTVNRDFEQLFGFERGAALGMPVDRLFADAADAMRILQDARSNGGIHERELRMQATQHQFWGLVSATDMPGRGGDGSFVMGFSDIDARKVLENRLTIEASTDVLTSLANRRFFFARAEVACEQARRYGRPLSIVMMDLDHFKAVNDTFGHSVGDAVLARAARMLQVTLRQTDLPARIGGEEFIALLPETDLQQAIEAAERIRQAVEDAPLTLEDGRLVNVTASFGVTKYQNESDIHVAIQRADTALYRAKDLGRNRVEVA